MKLAIYSRQQAIEDGFLIDISEKAKEAGFKIPVALTLAAWNSCVNWHKEDSARKNTYQDINGRLWDVLFMLRLSCPKMLSTFFYDLYVIPQEGKVSTPMLQKLKVVAHGGDHEEVVITIMLPGED